MKWILLTLLTSLVAIHASADEADEEKCLAYVRIGENYKTAHENESCLSAAKEGVASAQYSVGMGYGFAEKPELEKKYYRLAANNRSIAAYLALGHVLRDENIWEAIYWYQRHASTKVEGYGYSAILLSQIFRDLEDEEQAEYWLWVCNSSPVKNCEN